MLVRRRVAKLLAEYYAQPANRVVGSAFLTKGNNEINFNSLWGEWHYRRVCERLYAQQEGRWLTSVELMRPFYSQALANFVATQARAFERKEGFEVVEMGGGRATNASIILSHLQQHHPDVYDQLNSYTLMDASPSLIALQEETMRAGDHFDKMKFELKDMIDVAEQKVAFLTPSEIPTVLLTCELLDNLPHDKVRVKAGRLFEQGEVEEVAITRDDENDDSQQTEAHKWEEKFVPLSDPLLSTVLKVAPTTYARSSTITWIPSVACGVLHRLHQERPNSSLMFADFDWLPLPDLTEHNQERVSSWAPGEPIITDMNSADHACYLQAPPHCDILFPTDFPKLASFVSKSWNIKDSNNSQLQVDVLKQSDFLQKFGPHQVEATKSWLTGFSPMLHDFGNCSALTVTRRGKLEEPAKQNISPPQRGRKGKQQKRQKR